MSALHQRELADTRAADAHRRRPHVPTEVQIARAESPERFARVRAACQHGAGYLDLDAHAARIVNTVNRLEGAR